MESPVSGVRVHVCRVVQKLMLGSISLHGFVCETNSLTEAELIDLTGCSVGSGDALLFLLTQPESSSPYTRSHRYITTLSFSHWFWGSEF